MQNTIQYGKHFTVSQLRGGWALVYTNETGTRTRLQLMAKTRDEAIVEAHQRYSSLCPSSNILRQSD